MGHSMAEYLKQDMDCEGLLECFHGLTQLDRECFTVLIESEGPLTVDELAERVDRERSTAYRSVQRLLAAGFIEKEQVNYDQGGYYHVYQPVEPRTAAADMERMLDEWYAKMGELIEEFEDKYADAGDATLAES